LRAKLSELRTSGNLLTTFRLVYTIGMYFRRMQVVRLPEQMYVPGRLLPFFGLVQLSCANFAKLMQRTVWKMLMVPEFFQREQQSEWRRLHVCLGLYKHVPYLRQIQL
jgi:hypothetical protein